MSYVLTVLLNMLNFLIIKIDCIVLHHLTVCLSVCIGSRQLCLLLVVVALQLLHLKQDTLLLIVQAVDVRLVVLVILAL